MSPAAKIKLLSMQQKSRQADAVVIYFLLDATILDRLIEPFTKWVTTEAARKISAFKADDVTQQRIGRKSQPRCADANGTVQMRRLSCRVPQHHDHAGESSPISSRLSSGSIARRRSILERRSLPIESGSFIDLACERALQRYAGSVRVLGGVRRGLVGKAGISARIADYSSDTWRIRPAVRLCAESG
jgi:hypothetical protein